MSMTSENGFSSPIFDDVAPPSKNATAISADKLFAPTPIERNSVECIQPKLFGEAKTQVSESGTSDSSAEDDDSVNNDSTQLEDSDEFNAPVESQNPYLDEHESDGEGFEPSAESSKIAAMDQDESEESDTLIESNEQTRVGASDVKKCLRIRTSHIPTAPPIDYPVPIPLPIHEIAALKVKDREKLSLDPLIIDDSNTWDPSEDATTDPGFKDTEPNFTPPSPLSELQLPTPAPCLKGILSEEVLSKDHVVAGWWGMSKKAHLPGGEISAFELRRKSEVGDKLPTSGEYKSHFIVRVPGKPPEKVNEDELCLTFTINKLGEWNVEGAGKNKYGIFKIMGTMDSQLKLELFKIYPVRQTPEPLLRNVKRTSSSASFNRRRASQQSSGPIPAQLTVIPDTVKEPKEPTRPRGGKGMKRASQVKAAASLNGISSAGEEVYSEEKYYDEVSTPRRRISRMPSHLQEDPFKSSVKLSDGLRKCATLLKQISSVKKLSHWFREPVDPIALNLPSYCTIVKRPMDFSTLRNKLELGEYSSASEFASDMRLIFTNALAFTPDPREPVNIAARELSLIFEQKFAALGNLNDLRGTTKRRKSISSGMSYEYPGTPNMGTKRKSATNFGYGKKKKESFMPDFSVPASMEGTASIPVSQLFDMQRQMLEMQAKIQELQRKHASEVVGIPKSVNHHEPPEEVHEGPGVLTFEEKRQLSVNINKLPPEKLTRVVQIIQERMPIGTQEDAEIEIDIDSMDTGTLRELQIYVESCIRGGSKRTANRRAKPTYASESESDDEWA